MFIIDFIMSIFGHGHSGGHVAAATTHVAHGAPAPDLVAGAPAALATLAVLAVVGWMQFRKAS